MAAVTEWVQARRADKWDLPALLCLVDHVGADVSGVDKVLDRMEALGDQAFVDPVEGSDVLLGCRCGVVATWTMMFVPDSPLVARR
ncbi:hypothetical protein [Kitasatospora kifunensis]|uniref:Uncharacterized protein n=1 Tax=Kitasatospora kifunensis TaxID=58351 RepID=A0A7W7W039_KITKI|nr:hypothetical protein [Kitasatospora kifunensis]MBB4928379.1 hypothetical protein [Kitasatospora kifunensis]